MATLVVDHSRLDSRIAVMGAYPRWIYYPRSEAPPSWVADVASVFEASRELLDTQQVHNKSDAALAIIRPALEAIGFRVEGGSAEPTLHRPVHFGEAGEPDRKYKIDSYHPALRIGLEVEAGRAVRGNAIYRDLIQASLIVDLDFFTLAVPQKYRFNNSGKQTEEKPYDYGRTLMDAIYSSNRLRLPLKGMLLLGF